MLDRPLAVLRDGCRGDAPNPSRCSPIQKLLAIFPIRSVETNIEIVAGDLDFWPTLQIETPVPGDHGGRKARESRATADSRNMPSLLSQGTQYEEKSSRPARKG